MRNAVFTRSLAALSLFAIATSPRAETIKYVCGEGDTIDVDTNSQIVVVTDVSEGGADFNQPNVKITDEFVSYGTDSPIRIDRKTGAVDGFESGRWIRVDNCHVGK